MSKKKPSDGFDILPAAKFFIGIFRSPTDGRPIMVNELYESEEDARRSMGENFEAIVPFKEFPVWRPKGSWRSSKLPGRFQKKEST